MSEESVASLKVSPEAGFLAIRLLSTDFDGTLTGFPQGDRCVPALADELKAVVSSGGLWAVNTGRPLAGALEGLLLLSAPVEPH